MRYEKSEIQKGVYMTLACPVPAYVRYGDAPQQHQRPVRYGEPPDHQPFAEVREKLDSAHQRLKALAKAIADARRQ